MIKLIRFVTIIVILVPLLILLTHAFRTLSEDWQSCLYTFEVISPSIISSNKYILMRIKNYYSSTLY